METISIFSISVSEVTSSCYFHRKILKSYFYERMKIRRSKWNSWSNSKAKLWPNSCGFSIPLSRPIFMQNSFESKEKLNHMISTHPVNGRIIFVNGCDANLHQGYKFVLKYFFGYLYSFSFQVNVLASNAYIHLVYGGIRTHDIMEVRLLP
jgi:hypothetical protein